MSTTPNLPPAGWRESTLYAGGTWWVAVVWVPLGTTVLVYAGELYRRVFDDFYWCGEPYVVRDEDVRRTFRKP